MILWCVCCLLDAMARVLGVPVADGSPLEDRMNGLEVTTPAWIINQSSATVHPENANIVLRIAGKRLILQIKRNRKLLPPTFTVTHHLANGSLITETPSLTLNHCLYHGRVAGERDSLVVLSTCEGLRGSIVVGADHFLIEPLGRRGECGRHADEDKVDGNSEEHDTDEGMVNAAGTIGGAVRGPCFRRRRGYHYHCCPRHAVSRARDRQSRHGGGLEVAYGHTNLTQAGAVARSGRARTRAPHIRLKRSSAWRAAKHVELVLVADHAEFMKMGHDYWRTALRMMEIANHVDKFYRALGVRVPLVGVEIWSSGDETPVPHDPYQALAHFLSWRRKHLLPRKEHDNAQLVTGARFTGVTVGMAPLMGMCSREQSGGVNMDHTESVLGVASTVAHEMGHNFGLNHDGDARRCPCQHSAQQGGCIMAPATGHPYPHVFSSCSVRALRASLLEGGAPCVFNAPDVTALYGGGRCGNGYVEDGESCDCGEPQECDNPCCNATSCALALGADCAHGECCDRCRLLGPGHLCREGAGECDLPEFCTGTAAQCPQNAHAHDGQPCRGGGHCFTGTCVTLGAQCLRLWGPGAYAAPRECFVEVNGAGDKYGNCGKDTSGEYVTCTEEHALCGKLQCEGGAEAPVVGGGAVTIRTTVPTRGGRRVLCKGVHVYSDIPDPGLALAGTTCGPRKICHNRECVNVSTLGFEACSSKCNAHGVCNSKGNCHCDPGWDPPLCDQPGNGGSVDSGPVPPATGAGVVAGVVVASLLVLGIALTALALKCLRRPDWSVTTVLGSFRIASSPANALVKMCGAKRSPDGREGN
ncbi:disintegrin and metalloproteinase domain-containing protein 12-like isoform X2 [Lethenteron reissneri]|uniref:disintegrin and metalloproteinase domain-containing protein 12-like isoform X2 n=1 Tax=Lethenteron reissneri TaxID=7753 RepID=UPI002AB74505|nr:disintegrin and metalloproteinase domain-containing protein 12-like isoform X2 [Lethenteron reissneri]